MKNYVNSVMHRTGIPLTKTHHWKNFATTAEIKDTSHGYADKKNYKHKVRNVTEDESEAIGGESDKSEKSINRIEKINRITDRNNWLTALIKIKGIEKEFLVNTGSPISIMPVGEK